MFLPSAAMKGTTAELVTMSTQAAVEAYISEIQRAGVAVNTRGCMLYQGSVSRFFPSDCRPSQALS